MEQLRITQARLHAFARQLEEEERSCATVEKYMRSIRQFVQWLNGQPVTKAAVGAWKETLLQRGQASATVNAKLTALDRFLMLQGWSHCRVKHLRVQRRLFRAPERELDRSEYARLVDAAQKYNPRTSLVMETICATGIRVSEMQYITVEAVLQGKAEISLKGKIRTILLPGKLCRKLMKYANKQKIASGEIFLTRSGKRLSRKQIWAEMKAVCDLAGVAKTKVFPHNLRHLFARVFYQSCRDVARLADVLGHSSIETTRIYLISTGSEHIKTLERLRLVI